jgi:hypothetical protein
MLASRQTPRYRHNVRIANRQFCTEFLKKLFAAEAFPGKNSGAHHVIQVPFSRRRIFTSYQLMPICCVASGN